MGTDTQVRTVIDALAGVSSTGVRRRASRGGAERRRRAHRAPQARRPSRIHRRAGTDAALMSALTSTVPADLSVPQLEVALTTLAGHLNAATCRFGGPARGVRRPRGVGDGRHRVLRALAHLAVL
ncbi:hypothetical protein, partial [Pengzhenrongella sp.]|uniref:hypothetical protein n=1 Tax=Pengzhenrongella sp. TaxID=2888820 RepID=UPI002F9322AB